MKKRAKKNFIGNSKNIIWALLILAAAVTVYGVAQAATVSHEGSEITSAVENSIRLNGLTSEQILALQVPPGMIAMFDKACPEGWTRFAALDGRMPIGATAYGGTGGTASVTPTLNWNSKTQSEQGSYAWGGSDVTKADSYVAYPYAALTMIEMLATNNLPPYLNVIWCKKN